MSAYPVFEIQSLRKKLSDDLYDDKDSFVKIIQATNPLFKDTTGLEIYIPNEYDNFDILTDNINKIITFINTRLITKSNKMSENNTYVSLIKYIDPNVQNDLFIARHFLFFQILLYTTVVCKYENMFNTINSKYAFKYIYNKEIKDKLQDFQLGLFGSKNATSDIDLGIENFSDVKGLAYIVSIIESLFMVFTHKSNLDFDIEIYGNLLTLPNKNNIGIVDIKNPDYYYLEDDKCKPCHPICLNCNGANSN